MPCEGEGFRLLREQIEQGNPDAAVHSNVLYSCYTNTVEPYRS